MKQKETVDKAVNTLSTGARSFFGKASSIVEGSSGLKQFGIGTASGWLTGFLTTKVGKTAAASVGGTVLLIVAANEAKLISINWDKFNSKAKQLACRAEQKAPQFQNAGRFAQNNKVFAAGFVGGFLLGLVS